MIYLESYFSSAWEFVVFISVKITLCLLTIFIHDKLLYRMVFVCFVYLTEVTRWDNCAIGKMIFRVKVKCLNYPLAGGAREH